MRGGEADGRKNRCGSPRPFGKTAAISCSYDGDEDGLLRGSSSRKFLKSPSQENQFEELDEAAQNSGRLGFVELSTVISVHCYVTPVTRCGDLRHRVARVRIA